MQNQSSIPRVKPEELVEHVEFHEAGIARVVIVRHYYKKQRAGYVIDIQALNGTPMDPILKYDLEGDMENTVLVFPTKSEAREYALNEIKGWLATNVIKSVGKS